MNKFYYNIINVNYVYSYMCELIPHYSYKSHDKLNIHNT